MNDQPNPYDTVIADLRAKRDQIDGLIQSLESLKTGGIGFVPYVFSSSPSILGSIPSVETSGAIASGTFLGKGIEEAVRHLLGLRKRTMSAQEIAADLREGGLHLQSETPANTIASVLGRAFKAGGDIVRVSRGQWGLQEWYPNRRWERDE